MAPGVLDLAGHCPRARQRAPSRLPGREPRSRLVTDFSSSWTKGRSSREDSWRLCFPSPCGSDGGREPEPASRCRPHGRAALRARPAAHGRRVGPVLEAGGVLSRDSVTGTRREQLPPPDLLTLCDPTGGSGLLGTSGRPHVGLRVGEHPKGEDGAWGPHKSQLGPGAAHLDATARSGQSRGSGTERHAPAGGASRGQAG